MKEGDLDEFCIHDGPEDSTQHVARRPASEPIAITCQDNLDKMPDCAEKHLITMISATEQVLSHTRDKKASFEQIIDNLRAVLSKDLPDLTRLLTEECELDLEANIEIRSHISQLRDLVDKNALTKGPGDYQRPLRSLLAFIRHVDLEELFRLIEQNRKSASMIEDKEILLLLGNTGAGKSTCAHFLAGSKLMKSGNGNNAYEVADSTVLSNDLQAVKISSAANSETKFISPVKLDLERLIRKSGELYLCDTPGFEDTSGPEVDISNTFGLIHAIQKCKSVRPIAVLNYDGMGGRLEGIISLSNLLKRLMTDVDESLDSFTFFYTKFPLDFHILDMIKKSLEREGLDNCLKDIILSMEEKAEKSPNIIDPLSSSQAKGILKELRSLRPIENPSRKFKCFLTEKSLEKLKSQFILHEKSIQRALKRNDFALVAYKLDQLKKLKGYLTEISSLETDYKKIVEQLSHHFQEIYAESEKNFKSQLEHKNVLTAKDVSKYQDALKMFNQIQNIVDTHFEDPAKSDYKSYLEANLMSMSQSICKQIEENLEDGVEESYLIENVKILWQKFADQVEPAYAGLIANLKTMFKRKAEEFNQIKEPLDLNTIVAQLVYLRNAQKQLFSLSKGKYDEASSLNECCQKFKNLLLRSADKLTPLIESHDDENLDELVSKANGFLELIDKTIENTQLCTFISPEDLKNMRATVTSQLKIKLDSFQAHVVEITRDSSDSFEDTEILNQLEFLYERADKLTKISGFSTQDLFNIKEAIAQFVVSFNSAISAEFALFKDSENAKIDFRIIFMHTKAMKNANWLDHVKPNLYSNSIKSYEKDFIRRLNQLEDKLSYFNFRVNEHRELNEHLKMYAQIMQMKPLSELDKKFQDLISRAEGHFASRTSEAFESIRQTFSLDEKTLSFYESKLEELENQRETSSSSANTKFEREKDRFSKIISKLTDSNLDCFFSRLDGEFIQNALNYLKEFESHPRILKNEVTRLRELSRKFFSKYAEYAEKELDHCFGVIQNRADNSEEQSDLVRCNVQIVTSLLKELTSLGKDFPSVYFQIASNGLDLIESLNEKITFHAIEMQRKINSLRQDGDNSALNVQLDTARCLAFLDQYRDAGSIYSFAKIFEEFSNTAVDDAEDSVRNVLDSLKTKDFRGIGIELSSIQDMQVNAPSLRRIKHAINTSIRDLLESAKSTEKRINKEFDLRAIENLTTVLQSIKKARQELFDWLTDVNSNPGNILDPTLKADIDQEMANMSSKLAKKFTALLDAIHCLIEARDFPQAELERDKFEDAYSHLSEFVVGTENDDQSSSIQTRFEDINELIERNLSETIKHYAELPVTSYQSDSPRRLFEKLEKAAAEKSKYNEALDKIRNSIIENFTTFLSSNQSSQQAEDTSRANGMRSLTDRIDYVESILWCLPPSIEEQLKTRLLSRIQATIEKKDSSAKTSLTRCFENHDVDRISEIINGELSDQLFNEIKEELTNRIENIVAFVNKSLTHTDPLKRDMIENCITLSKYHEKLNSKISIQHSVDNVKENMKKRYTEASQNLFKKPKTSTSAEVLGSEKDLNDCLTLYELDQHVPDFFPIKPMLDKDITKVKEYFEQNFKNFCEAHDNLDAQEAAKYLAIAFEKSTLVEQLERSLQQTSISLIKMLQKIEKTFQEFEAEIGNSKLNSIAEFKYEVKRMATYSDYRRKSLFYKSMEQLIEKMDKENEINLRSRHKKILETLENKMSELKNSILNIVSSPSIPGDDLALLKFYYENIHSYEKAFEKDAAISIISQVNRQLIQKFEAMMDDSVRKETPDEGAVIKNLLAMKQMSDNLVNLKPRINSIISKCLEQYKMKTSVTELLELSLKLENDEVGVTIVTEFEIFKGELIRILNQKTKGHGIDYVINNTTGDAFSAGDLNQEYSDFNKTYDQVLKEFLVKRNATTDEIMKRLLKLVSDSKAKAPELVKMEKIPEILAYVCAIWSLQSRKYYEEMKNSRFSDDYILKPHPAQVVAILRLFGFGFKKTYFISKKELFSNLVQLETGEGKSIILGITSCVLALIGYDVSCVCYSEYLSNRDYNSFKDIFTLMGLANHITYGTFGSICRPLLSKKVDIDVEIPSIILTGKMTSTTQNASKHDSRPNILLVDEVDVFFDTEFIGKSYNAGISLNDFTISQFLDKIWQNKGARLEFAAAQRWPEYIACMKRFNDWTSLLEKEFEKVVNDLNDFDNHQYVIKDDKIGYKIMDGVCFSTYFGYYTMFAYYHEHTKGNITQMTLDRQKRLQIYSCSFSYSKFPSSFKHILGVTGTLKNLNSIQRKLIRETQGIKFFTFIPSLYGANKRNFNPATDTCIHRAVDYNMRLKEEIDRRALGSIDENFKRPILIFFATNKSLDSFYNSDFMQDFQAKVNIIKEETTLKDKDYFIREATKPGQITLLARVFGRGIDFVCRNQKVLQNGGVHVIQTFFSETESEEVQIMGRTARQGADGSFSLVLKDTDLKPILGDSYLQMIDEMRSKNEIYATLKKKRAEMADRDYKKIRGLIDDAEKGHKTSQDFLRHLENNEIDWVKTFLNEQA